MSLRIPYLIKPTRTGIAYVNQPDGWKFWPVGIEWRHPLFSCLWSLYQDTIRTVFFLSADGGCDWCDDQSSARLNHRETEFPETEKGRLHTSTRCHLGENHANLFGKTAYTCVGASLRWYVVLRRFCDFPHEPVRKEIEASYLSLSRFTRTGQRFACFWLTLRLLLHWSVVCNCLGRFRRLVTLLCSVAEVIFLIFWVELVTNWPEMVLKRWLKWCTFPKTWWLRQDYSTERTKAQSLWSGSSHQNEENLCESCMLVFPFSLGNRVFRLRCCSR